MCRQIFLLHARAVVRRNVEAKGPRDIVTLSQQRGPIHKPFVSDPCTHTVDILLEQKPQTSHYSDCDTFCLHKAATRLP